MRTDKYQHFRSCCPHTRAHGKKQKIKNPIHYVGSLARPYINSESASKHLNRLGMVKSSWLWHKRRREHIGIVLDGFATLSSLQYITPSLVKGVSCAGFPFYFLSVVECTSFHQSDHTTKCFSLRSFLLELTSWQRCSQPDRQSWWQSYMIFTVSIG